MSKSNICRSGLLMLSAAALFMSSCKQDDDEVIIRVIEPCVTYTELTGQGHLADLSVLAGSPEFMDTLNKYPQLQVYKAQNDQYSTVMQCNIFYKGLKVFTDFYVMSKNKRENSIYVSGEVPDSIGISLAPSLSYTDAIAVARKQINFGTDCLSYRLGIYDINATTSFQPKNYKLVWMITTGVSYGQYVVVDAHNGATYMGFGGLVE